MSDRASEADFPIPLRRPLGRDRNAQTSHDALADELQEAVTDAQAGDVGRRAAIDLREHDAVGRFAAPLPRDAETWRGGGKRSLELLPGERRSARPSRALPASTPFSTPFGRPFGDFSVSASSMRK